MSAVKLNGISVIGINQFEVRERLFWLAAEALFAVVGAVFPPIETWEPAPLLFRLIAILPKTRYPAFDTCTPSRPRVNYR